MLPIIWENNDYEEINIQELDQNIWKNIPKDLANLILKEYLFSLEDLEQACSKNDKKTIQFICKNCKLDWNKCLILASMNGYIHVVKYVIRMGATDKLRALMVASLFGQTKIKEFLKKLVD